MVLLPTGMTLNSQISLQDSRRPLCSQIRQDAVDPRGSHRWGALQFICEEGNTTHGGDYKAQVAYASGNVPGAG